MKNSEKTFDEFEELVLELDMARIIFAEEEEEEEEARIVVSIKDITERKQLEEALRETEEKYRLIFQSEPDALFLTELGEKGTVIDANETSLRMYGYSLDEMRRMRIVEFSSEPEKTIRSTVLPIGSVFAIPLRWHRKKDGTVFPVEIIGSVFEMNGRGVILAVHRDITERKRAEEALRVSLEKYRVLFESFPLGITISDKSGKIMEGNRLSERLLGIARDAHAQRRIDSKEWQIIRKDGTPMPADEYASTRALRENRLIENVEMGIVKDKGEITWISVTAVPIPLEGYGVAIAYGDITERLSAEQAGKRAEEALHRSEENFRRSLDDSPLGVRIVTAEGETIYANRATLNIYGYVSIEELNTTPVKKRYSPESYAEFQGRREKRKQGDYGLSEYELSIIRKNGDVRHLQVFRKEVLWDGERQFQVVYQDISERKLAEQTQMRLVAMLDVTPGFVGFADAKYTHILYINSAGRKMVGVQAQEDVTQLKIADVHPEWTNKLLRDEIIPTAIREGLWTGECAFLNRNGHEIPVMMALLAHKSPSGDVERFSTVSIDITERKRSEEELRASREQLRALAGRLQAVREEERTDIAREIHDELGGALTGMKVDVSFLIKSALKIENKAARTSLLAGMDSVTKSIDTTIHAVRRIAMELRPGILDDLGLVAALEWQLKDFEKRTGIRCEFFPPVEDISLDADLSTALFRIFQEALTNVVRHSGATAVRVRLRADADSSTLEVEDNGKGIEKEKLLSLESLGLLGMRERAQMFGGRITVTGTPGTGTKVMVDIPPVEKGKMDRDQK